MNTSLNGFGQDRRPPVRRGWRLGCRIAQVVSIGLFLAALPISLRITSDLGIVGIGMAEAVAQGRGNGNSNGNGGNERSAPPDRDIDRDNGPNDRDTGDDRDTGNDRDNGDDRGKGGGQTSPNGGSGRAGGSVPGSGAGTANRGAASSVPRSTVPNGQASVEREHEPGPAPTEAGTARTRAMVEIAKEMGANAPNPTEHPPISGRVTQEMLDVAEDAYVAAVQEAWEAHGFPWTDPDVLRSLGDLESLVSSLESIMASTAPGPISRPDVTVAPDINNDGFVDINDLWDAHQR